MGLFPYQNTLKDLDPSCVRAHDLRDRFGREKPIFSESHKTAFIFAVILEARINFQFSYKKKNRLDLSNYAPINVCVFPIWSNKAIF